MIGCATAGAIASIFNAPIAAIIFTIEIFSLDLTLVSLVPLLLASVSGAVTSIFMEGNDSLFQYSSIDPFRIEDLPWYDKKFEKIYKVVSKLTDDLQVLITIDANTGQNGLNQTREFNKYIPLDGIILTKKVGEYTLWPLRVARVQKFILR